ncbi:MAG TPA: hypothetical protein ENN43_07370 [bacterium]|nr:hypothetical protein [bacterium]
MLKKKAKEYIITIITVFFCLLSVTEAAASSNSAGALEVRPVYIFENKSGRDPFRPRSMQDEFPAIVEVSITAFSLQGITTDSLGTKAALFRSRSGTDFGYIFINGRLYGENNNVITGIAGEVRSDREVLLIQGDREVLFRLEEFQGGPNIRPDVPGNAPAGQLNNNAGRQNEDN